jgi:hypothetical protein
MAYIILCLRLTLVVHLIVSSHCKALPLLRLRAMRNTRYGWLAKPYPTGTYTGAASRLQDASSLLDALTPQAGERANVLAQPVSGFPMTWFVRHLLIKLKLFIVF